MQVTLKRARQDKGWTLDDLAKRVGVAASTISRIERGETIPLHATATAIEAALGLKRGTLVFGHEVSA